MYIIITDTNLAAFKLMLVLDYGTNRNCPLVQPPIRVTVMVRVRQVRTSTVLPVPTPVHTSMSCVVCLNMHTVVAFLFVLIFYVMCYMLDVTQRYLQKNNNFRVVVPPVLFQNKTRGGRSWAQHARWNNGFLERRLLRCNKLPLSEQRNCDDAASVCYGWQQKLSFQISNTISATVGKSGSFTRHSPALYVALDKLFACFLRRCKAFVHHRDSSFSFCCEGGGAIVPMGGEKAEIHSTKTKSTQMAGAGEIQGWKSTEMACGTTLYPSYATGLTDTHQFLSWLVRIVNNNKEIIRRNDKDLRHNKPH